MMYDFEFVLCARACRLPDVGSAFFVLIQNSHSSYYVLKLSARKIRTCTRYRVLVWPRPQNHICFTLLQVSVNSMTARNSESCLLRSGIDGDTFDLYVYEYSECYPGLIKQDCTNFRDDHSPVIPGIRNCRCTISIGL
jgi:hypothetical protein